MGTIKIVLKSNQPKKDGTIPILIRVTINRRVKYVSTGYSVKQHQFKEGQENWVSRHPDAKLINAAIEVKRSEYAEKLLRADIDRKPIDIWEIDSKHGKTFFWAVRQRLETFEKRNQVGSYDRLTSKFNVLKKIWGRDVLLSDLNHYHVEKLISHRLASGISSNTIKKDLTDFSGVLTAIEHSPDPFKRAQRSVKAGPVNKEKLTAEDIRALETTKLTGLPAVVRDIFLFAFYTHGMRIESVLTFEYKMIRNGLIKYRMNKGRKVREIEIHQKLSKIIERYKGNKPYLFPIVKQEIKDPWQKKNIITSATVTVNTYLGRVAILCGIDKHITSHLARHTFAYLSKRRGVSTDMLKDALGHSTVKITEAYLKSFSDDEINKAVRGVYD